MQVQVLPPPPAMYKTEIAVIIVILAALCSLLLASAVFSLGAGILKWIWGL